MRHKAGDIIGDLALLGGRLKAHIIADRPSHQGNVALAQRLIRTAERQGGHVLEISQIMDILPHRYPFLLVDRIIEVEEERRIVGIKNVTINEPFFQGHFPGHPIMPGRADRRGDGPGGRHAADGQADRSGEARSVYFMALDNVKFRRPVVPGDQLRLEVDAPAGQGPDPPTQGRGVRRGPAGVRRPRCWHAWSTGDRTRIHPDRHHRSRRRRSASMSRSARGRWSGPSVEVGDRCRLGPRVDARAATCGSRPGVQVGEGSLVGGDPQDLKYRGEETWVEIGAGHADPRVLHHQPRHHRDGPHRGGRATASS